MGVGGGNLVAHRGDQADAHRANLIEQHDRQATRGQRRCADQAGFDRSKRYPLLTTEDISGLAESAILFATQLRDVGVTIDVVKQESNKFYDESWLKAPLYTQYWGTNDSVVFFASKTMVSDAPWNEAAWKDAAFDQAYRQAISTADPAQRKQAAGGAGQGTGAAAGAAATRRAHRGAWTPHSARRSVPCSVNSPPGMSWPS